MTAFVFTHYFQLDRSTREVELGLEYGPPVMNIGGQSWKFEDGQWITGIERKSCMYCCICYSLNGQHNINSCFSLSLLIPESGGNVSGRELQRLKKRNVQLEEENNLLKLKIEILLDMVRIYQLRLYT